MRTSLRWLGLAALVLGLAPPATARDLQAEIRIRVIYAAKSATDSLDPALGDLRPELIDLPFNKFRLLDKLESTVAINSSVELQFPGERSIAVRFLGLDVSGDKEMLSLRLAVKPRLNMQLRIADGGRTLIGGPSHLEGTLFLDVTARLRDLDAPPEAMLPRPADSPLQASDPGGRPATPDGDADQAGDEEED